MNFIDDLIPLFAIMMVFGIPLAAIMTHHQRKMAELIHGKGDNQNPNANMEPLLREIQAMRGEISDLKQRVNDQTIMIDEMKSLPKNSSEDFGSRLKEDQHG